MSFSGKSGVDGSYFGGKHKGKQSGGAAGKAHVFGLLKRGGKVYIKITPNAQAATLLSIIQERTMPDSIVYAGSLWSYNVFDISRFNHVLIQHGELFADRKNHINRIENS